MIIFIAADRLILSYYLIHFFKLPPSLLNIKYYFSSYSSVLEYPRNQLQAFSFFELTISLKRFISYLDSSLEILITLIRYTSFVIGSVVFKTSLLSLQWCTGSLRTILMLLLNKLIFLSISIFTKLILKLSDFLINCVLNNTLYFLSYSCFLSTIISNLISFKVFLSSSETEKSHFFN